MRLVPQKSEIALIAVFFLLSSCSSGPQLRKFEKEETMAEIPADLQKKFEVKDVSVKEVAVIDQPKKEVKAVKKLKTVPNAASPAKPNPPNRRPEVLPMSLGEQLHYDIRYVGVTAGTLVSTMLPLKEINGRTVFHIGAKIKTVKFFELVYRVDDEIESFWDYDGLYSHRYTMNLDESKQTRKVVELYDYDRKKSFFWNRVDHVEKGFSEKKEEFDIPLWAQDPVSTLYYMRTLKLEENPDKVTSVPVILDGKPWDIQVRFQKRESIYANGKKQEALKFLLQAFENGELKHKENFVWISNDEKRLVLRIEAKVRVGSFAIALEKVL